MRHDKESKKRINKTDIHTHTHAYTYAHVTGKAWIPHPLVQPFVVQ